MKWLLCLSIMTAFCGPPKGVHRKPVHHLPPRPAVTVAPVVTVTPEPTPNPEGAAIIRCCEGRPIHPKR